MAKTPEPRHVSKKHQARLEVERAQALWIRIGTGIVIVLVLGLIIFGVLDQYVLKQYRAVATVNGQKITVSQLDSKIRFDRNQLVQNYTQTMQMMQMFGSNPADPNNPFASQLQQVQSQLDPTNAVALGQQSLEELISDAIVSQEAQKRGITVSQQEVDTYMQGIFNYFPNGTPTPSVTPTVGNTSTLSPTQLALVTATATATLAPSATPTLVPTATATATAGPTSTPYPTATPYTQAGYEKEVQTYSDNLKKVKLSESDLRDAVYAMLLHNKLLDVIEKDVKPVQEQVWARHILVKDAATAQTVIAKLKAGGDFAKLAAQYSTDTSTKDKGGDLGWFGKGQMVAAFETAAFSMKIGEISPAPVQSTFGFHVIQVLGHEVRPLSASDFQNLKTTQFNTWVQTQETAGKITRNDFWQAEVPTDPALPVQQ
jgi:peptidyl-prolyl cis-trans isomerase D